MLYHSIALIHRSTQKVQYNPLRYVGIIFYSFNCIHQLFMLYDFASFPFNIWQGDLAANEKTYCILHPLWNNPETYRPEPR